jgi:hypothetical protein
MQANGSMSLFLMSKKLVASPSHHRRERRYHAQTQSISPTSSWRSRRAQKTHPRHGYGNQKRR